ncbi:MAG TPA: hypothetical protein DCE44_01050 [Verrucomicrobiales bacterium]|nr:hypothetical protein [Verrucomicrobiales bacterium]
MAVGAAALSKSQNCRPLEPISLHRQEQAYLGLDIVADQIVESLETRGCRNGTEVVAEAFCG